MIRLKKILLVFAIIFTLFAANAIAAEADSNSACAFFFYKTGCSYCASADSKIKAMEAKYPNLDVNRIDSISQQALLNGLYAKYNVPKYFNGYPVWGNVPVLFLGKEYLIGETPIVSGIETEILKHAKFGIACPDQNFEAYADENTLVPLQPETGGNTIIPNNTNLAIVLIGLTILVAAIAIAAVFLLKPEKAGEAKKEEMPSKKKKKRQKTKHRKA